MELIRQNETIGSNISILKEVCVKLYQFNNNEKMNKTEREWSVKAIDNLENSIHFLKLLMEE